MALNKVCIHIVAVWWSELFKGIGQAAEEQQEQEQEEEQREEEEEEEEKDDEQDTTESSAELAGVVDFAPPTDRPGIARWRWWRARVAFEPIQLYCQPSRFPLFRHFEPYTHTQRPHLNHHPFHYIILHLAFVFSIVCHHITEKKKRPMIYILLYRYIFFPIRTLLFFFFFLSVRSHYVLHALMNIFNWRNYYINNII